jgi:hypothetical protein
MAKFLCSDVYPIPYPSLYQDHYAQKTNHTLSGTLMHLHAARHPRIHTTPQNRSANIRIYSGTYPTRPGPSNRV